MTKTDKKARAEIPRNKEAAYTMMPWSCNHYPTFSEVEAYLPITGDFEIVVDIHNSKGVDAEVVATLITRAVNAYTRNEEMIGQMVAALELCLNCAAGLSWEAEHEAEAVLKKNRQNAVKDSQEEQRRFGDR